MKTIKLLLLLVCLFLSFAIPQNRSTLGDINDDGSVDVLDILMQVNIIMGQYNPSLEEALASDVNVDLITDIQDIVITVSYILGTLCPSDLLMPCEYDFSECCQYYVSHFENWTLDSLGGYGSRINDVVLINEDEFYIVGLFYIDTVAHNVAKWTNGDWQFIDAINPHIELFSIFYFNEEDIWVTSEAYPKHWDGESWTQYHLYNLGLDVSAGRGIWGTSSSNMYFCGDEGGIVHFNGDEFQQIESNSNVDLKDISGNENGDYIFVVGYDVLEEPLGNTILRINNFEVDELYYSNMYSPGEYGSCRAVSVVGDTAIIKVDVGLLKYNWNTGFSNLTALVECCDEYQNGVLEMAINESDDIFMVQGVGRFMHYNGSTWQLEDWLYHQRPTRLNAVSQKKWICCDRRAPMVI